MNLLLILFIAFVVGFLIQDSCSELIEGSTNSIECKQKEYYDNDAGNCIKCENKITNSVTEVNNLGGSNKKGLKNICVCEPGTYYIPKGGARPSICSKCPAGTYNQEYGYNMSCSSCPPGTYSDEGSTSCTKCPTGTYSDNHGSASCTKCPDPNIYSIEGSKSASFCGDAIIGENTIMRQFSSNCLFDNQCNKYIKGECKYKVNKKNKLTDDLSLIHI